MYLDTIAEYLESNGIGKIHRGDSTVFNPGDFAIYIGSQGQRDDCLTLYANGGTEPENTFGATTFIENPGLQIICRGSGYTGSWNKIYQAYKLLNNNKDLFISLKAAQSPAGIGKDDQGRVEWSVNFKIIKIND